MLPSFQVFGLTVPMFGVMMMTGMLAAFLLLTYTHRFIGFTEDELLSCALWAIILGLLGSKLLFWIVELDRVIADPHYLLETLREGFVFYGALIGGMIGVAVYCVRKKLPFFAFADLFIPSLVLAQGFGRIGCFCAGCCYGSQCAVDHPLAVVYPAGGAAPAGVPLLPTQLMESAFLFLLTITLVLILRRKKTFGTVTGWYMILYGVWRFIIEFYRSDDRGAVGALSTSQFIGIFIVVAGFVLLLLIKLRVLNGNTLPERATQQAEAETSDAEAESPAEPVDHSLEAVAPAETEPVAAPATEAAQAEETNPADETPQA